MVDSCTFANFIITEIFMFYIYTAFGEFKKAEKFVFFELGV